MNGKSIVIAIGVVVALVGGYLLLRNGQDDQPQISESSEVSPTLSASPSASPTNSGAAQVSVKTFTVSGK